MGRLALRKGEGEGEGLFEKLARAGGEPLTLVLPPSPRGEAREIGRGLLCIAVVIGLTARGNDREHEHPDDIDEVPVVTDCAKRGETTVFEITDKSYTEHDQQGKQTEADVQSVEPSKREKCRREKIQADGHAALKEMPVFQSLPDDENASEHNRRDEPSLHFPEFVCTQARFGPPNRKAARKQADAEDAGLKHVQLLRPGPALRSRIVKKVREDQHSEEACFGNDESEDAGFDFVRSKSVDRSSYGYDRIRTIGVRIIPERTSAANRRKRMEILMRRR